MIAAELNSKVAEYLNSHPFELSGTRAGLAQRHAVELGAFAKARRDVAKAFTGPGHWQPALRAFWVAVAHKLQLPPPVALRLSVNPPEAYPQTDLYRLSTVEPCIRGGDHAGNVGELLRAGDFHGDVGTYHVDDLTVFALNGYDTEAALADLAKLLLPGSTVTCYYPTEARHSLWLEFFGLVSYEPLLDFVSNHYKVERLSCDLQEDFSVQIFGIS